MQKNAELTQKLAELFKVEAKEHLQCLTDGLLEAEREEGCGDELMQSLFRAAHSLKGASRAVEANEVELLCSSLEDALDALRKKTIRIEKELVDLLLEAVEVLEKLIFTQEPQATSELTAKLEAIIEKNVASKRDSSQDVEEEPKRVEKETSVFIKSPTISPYNKAPQQPSKRDDNAIRISLPKIDALLQNAEEMLMLKLHSQQKTQQIDHILAQVKELQERQRRQEEALSLFAEGNRDKEGGAFESKEHEKNQELFKSTIAQLESIKILCEQDQRITATLVDAVIDETKNILMQPFTTLVQGLPKMVRDIALQLGKEASLEVIGEEIEVDRRILEKLKDPLIHILRNSLDHGIETGEERKERGKCPRGKITLTAQQINGSEFQLTISDDGRGIDLEAVKSQALRQGLLSKEESELVEKEHLFRCIFASGFSTSPIITDISGRGIGLNVLQENVERLGGVIALSSIEGEGVSTTITLPLTLATFRGIHIEAGSQEFVIPTTHVTRVLRITQEEALVTEEGQKSLLLDGISYAYRELSQILGLSSLRKCEGKRLLILLLKARNTTVALGVDAIHNEQEIYVKNTGKLLKKVRFIAATTIMEWGKLIPILDPFDLIESATQKQTLSFVPADKQKPEKRAEKSILVVEDSLTSRMLLKNILEATGYKVACAVDGVEGFALLEKGSFDLVLSDVEMPRMGGFELTHKIRSKEKYKRLPLVLCTTRGSEEDRKRGIQVGANAYINKNTFTQKNLLQIIQQLL